MTLAADTERPRSSSEGSRVSSYDTVLPPAAALHQAADACATIPVAGAQADAAASDDTEVSTMQIGLETIQLEAGIVQKCKRGVSFILLDYCFKCTCITIYKSYLTLHSQENLKSLDYVTSVDLWSDIIAME